MHGSSWRRAAVCAVVAILVHVMTGCSHPVARDRTAWRQARFQRWVDAFRTREAERGQVVQRDLAEIRRLWERDVARFAQDLEQLEAWNRAAERRWRERQPAYRRAIQSQLEGDLPHVVETAAVMFF